MMNTGTYNMHRSLIHSIMFEPTQLDTQYNSLDTMRVDALTHTPTPLWMAVHLGELECIQHLMNYANEIDRKTGTKTVLTGSIISKRAQTKSTHSTFDNAFELALRYSNNQKQHKKRQEIAQLLFKMLHLKENEPILQECLKSPHFKKQYEKYRDKIKENVKITAHTTLEQQEQPTPKDTLPKDPSEKREKPNNQHAQPAQDLQAMESALKQQEKMFRKEQKLNDNKAEEDRKIEQRNQFKSNVFSMFIICTISACTMAYINPYNIGTMLSSISGVGLIVSISLFIMVLAWIQNPQLKCIQPFHKNHQASQRSLPPQSIEASSLQTVSSPSLRTSNIEMNDVTAAPHSDGADTIKPIPAIAPEIT